MNKQPEFLQDDLRVFVVPVDILNVPDLTTHEKMVYVILRSFANPHKAEAFPSYETIARMGSMSRRHAINCVKRLVEKGLILKEERLDVTKNRKIRNTSNLYKLQTPKVVNTVHQGSEPDSPPLVNTVHQGSEYSSPDHNHLTDPSEQDHLNNSRDVVVVANQIESHLGKPIKSLRPLLNKWIEEYGEGYLIEKAKYIASKRPKVRNIIGAYRAAVTENYETTFAEVAATGELSNNKNHDRYEALYELFPDSSERAVGDRYQAFFNLFPDA